MLVEASFPARTGFFSQTDVENLEKALGFPQHCLLRNIPTDCWHDKLISVATFYKLIDDSCFSRELNFSFDFNSAKTHTATLIKAISALNKRKLNYLDIELARTAYRGLEKPDRSGMPIDSDTLLKALRLTGRIISRLKLERIVHHATKYALVKGRLQLSEFIQLLPQCRLYNDAAEEYQIATGHELPTEPAPDRTSTVRGKRGLSFWSDKVAIVGVPPDTVRDMPFGQLRIAECQKQPQALSLNEDLIAYLDKLYVKQEYPYQRENSASTLGDSSFPNVDSLLHVTPCKYMQHELRMRPHQVPQTMTTARLLEAAQRLRSKSQASTTTVWSPRLPVSPKRHFGTVGTTARSRAENEEPGDPVERPQSSFRRRVPLLVNEDALTARQLQMDSMMVDTILLQGHYDEQLLEDIDVLRPGLRQKILSQRKARSEKERDDAINAIMREPSDQAGLIPDIDRLVKPLSKRIAGRHEIFCDAVDTARSLSKVRKG